MHSEPKSELEKRLEGLDSISKIKIITFEIEKLAKRMEDLSRKVDQIETRKKV